MIKSIGTNCPAYRGAEHPAFDPLKINERSFSRRHEVQGGKLAPRK